MKELEFNLSGKSVAIVIPCYSGYIPIELGTKLIQIIFELQQLGIGVDLIAERENSIISSVRNRLVYRFLNESSADYLFWIDDDIIFEPEDFITTLALTTKLDIVGVPYPTRSDELKFFIRYVNDNNPEYEEEYGLLKTKGMGMGFICMSRKLLQSVFDDHADEVYNEKDMLPRDLFKIKRVGTRYWGEDMYFLNMLYERYNQITFGYLKPKLKHVGRKDYQTNLTMEKAYGN